MSNKREIRLYNAARSASREFAITLWLHAHRFVARVLLTAKARFYFADCRPRFRFAKYCKNARCWPAPIGGFVSNLLVMISQLWSSVKGFVRRSRVRRGQGIISPKTPIIITRIEYLSGVHYARYFLKSFCAKCTNCSWINCELLWKRFNLKDFERKCLIFGKDYVIL